MGKAALLCSRGSTLARGLATRRAHNGTRGRAVQRESSNTASSGQRGELGRRRGHGRGEQMGRRRNLHDELSGAASSCGDTVERGRGGVLVGILPDLRHKTE